jgi:hypothetical protein
MRDILPKRKKGKQEEERMHGEKARESCSKTKAKKDWKREGLKGRTR